jgi:hypothetical protein
VCAPTLDIILVGAIAANVASAPRFLVLNKMHSQAMPVPSSSLTGDKGDAALPCPLPPSAAHARPAQPVFFVGSRARCALPALPELVEVSWQVPQVPMGRSSWQCEPPHSERMLAP